MSGSNSESKRAKTPEQLTLFKGQFVPAKSRRENWECAHEFMGGQRFRVMLTKKR